MRKLLLIFVGCISVVFIFVLNPRFVYHNYYKFTHFLHDITNSDILYVDIVGNNIVQDADIISKIYHTQNDVSVLKSQDEIMIALNGVSIIKNTVIRYDAKGGMMIVIKERKPIIFFNKEGNIALLDQNFEEFSYGAVNLSKLIFVRGKFDVKNIKTFYNYIQKYPVIFRYITEIENFYNYRFNIVINNKILILLPENNLDDAVKILTDLIISNDILQSDVKVIDMRRPKWIALQFYKPNERHIYIPQSKKILHVGKV